MPAEPQSRAGDSTIKYVVIGCVAMLLIVAVLAGVYFTVLRKAEATDPEKVVIKYFDSIASGDINALRSCFTESAAPDQSVVDALQKSLSAGTFTIEDVKLDTVSQVGDEALVEVKDYTVKATGGGQTVKIKMSDIMSGTIIRLNLVRTNGEWLINTKPASSGTMF